ncbi:unnamed protein product [Caenorhabditis angaria]|uniref:Uncharacterized protein n=1 Tax=Caenorhabditis angaria TaxID=860376 RepID=A0A9P1I7H9_9PELO|nr:unnamed protein product [Caenorhabditis angaria]
MRRVVADQTANFQSDHFLAQLAHFSEAKFTLFEHAPIGERRQRFRNLVQQQKMTLTFSRTGITIPIQLEFSEELQNELNFRSLPLIFNGVWVKIRGAIGFDTLEGRVQFEKIDEPPEELEFLSDSQLQQLRSQGLPI